MDSVPVAARIVVPVADTVTSAPVASPPYVAASAGDTSARPIAIVVVIATIRFFIDACLLFVG